MTTKKQRVLRNVKQRAPRNVYDFRACVSPYLANGHFYGSLYYYAVHAGLVWKQQSKKYPNICHLLKRNMNQS